MLDTKFSKVALCAAGGAVAAMTAAGPAMATNSVPTAPPATSHSTEQLPKLGGSGKVYWGKVIARTGLKIRSGPSQSYRVIGVLHYGQTVKIKCKVNGQWINGNPRWYKLADGRWAWASARYIKNIGAAPEWCRYR
ncbi:SH3 domain-containing protein [Streptomyces armeniacus]|uniref:SH3 domain-containing protein n=1 Tax=Streptomyces armeniacus TaxID=83291 RepID=A0A345XII5_9ACTN|nr:SH3 domain-containing protein [Streptomyces armeniacus]AXK31451.1 SH3 domain-containing protein [Streptomyces armeniacus]